MILLKRYIFPIFICGGKYVNHQFPSDLPSQTIKPLNATALSYWMIAINIIPNAITTITNNNCKRIVFIIALWLGTPSF